MDSPPGIFQKLPWTLTWHGMTFQNHHSFSYDVSTSFSARLPAHSLQLLSWPQASMEGNWPENPSSLNSQMPYFVFLIYLLTSQRARAHHFTSQTLLTNAY